MKRLSIYGLILLLILLLIGAIIIILDRQQAIADLSTTIATVDTEQAALKSRLNQQAQRAATAEVVATKLHTELERVSEIPKPHSLQWQGINLVTDKPLLGLRLLLEAWHLSSASEQEAIEPIIKQVINQGRIAALSQEELLDFQDKSRLVPPYTPYTYLTPVDMDVSEFITSSLPIAELEVYVTPSKRHFVIEYTYDVEDYAEIKYGYELRRMTDGQLFVAVNDSYLVTGYRFFVSPEEKYFGANPNYGAGARLYRMEDGKQIQALKEFDSVRFSPGSNYYLVGQSKGSRAVRAYRDGQFITVKMKGHDNLDFPYYSISDLDFSRDNQYFVLQAHANSTLYYMDEGEGSYPKIYPLLDWGEEKEGQYFVADKPHLVVWYSDNRTYLLDLAWLKDIQTTSAMSLIELACIPFTGKKTLFNEAELEPYLKGQEPLACQN